MLRLVLSSPNRSGGDRATHFGRRGLWPVVCIASSMSRTISSLADSAGFRFSIANDDSRLGCLLAEHWQASSSWSTIVSTFGTSCHDLWPFHIPATSQQSTRPFFLFSSSTHLQFVITIGMIVHCSPRNVPYEECGLELSVVRFGNRSMATPCLLDRFGMLSVLSRLDEMLTRESSVSRSFLGEGIAR
jgi:hypothetical protein